jgi:hypothetical protein
MLIHTEGNMFRILLKFEQNQTISTSRAHRQVIMLDFMLEDIFLKKFFNLGCLNIGFTLIKEINMESDLKSKAAKAEKLKRYKDTRWDQFYPRAENLSQLENLLLKIVKSYECLVKADKIAIESLGHDESYT